MKEIQKATINYVLHRLYLEKAKMEFMNDYVFGFDDVERIIKNFIEFKE